MKVWIYILLFHHAFSWAQTSGNINYNTGTNTLEAYLGGSWKQFGNGTNLGLCSTPGTYEYSPGDGAWRWCNGSNWKTFSVITTAVPCTTTGALELSGNYYRFCDGSFWHKANQTSSGYFVLTSATYTGDLGGLTGADSKCLTNLTAQNWMGKAQAQAAGLLDSTDSVRAFLCDSTSCNNLYGSESYAFAVAGSPATGGAVINSGGSGEGPLDSANWSGATYFGGSYDYWTGRDTSSATEWGGPWAFTCTDWTSFDTNDWGGYGISANTNGNRWNSTDMNCDVPQRLVCIVHPTDTNPDNFDFTDITNATPNSLVVSNIVRMTGFTGTMLFTPSGAAGIEPAEMRVCSDAACSAVVTDWTENPTEILSGNYVQLRTVTFGNNGSGFTVWLYFGTKFDMWNVSSDSSADNSPNAISFTDISNATLSATYTSEIRQVTGITTATVFITGDGQYRICADATCSSVVKDWRIDSSNIVNNQYVQMRMTASAHDSTERSSNLLIGESSPGTPYSVPWKVTTPLDTTKGRFVMINYMDGAMGGIAGADAQCLTRLTTNNWIGKAASTLNSTKVKAFLCTSSSCQNLVANTTYVFAVAGSPTVGGATMTSNASGLGPNNSDIWSDSSHFGVYPGSSDTIWTGRVMGGSSTTWPSTPSGATCSDWTSNDNAGSGNMADTNTTDFNRWYTSSTSCDSTNTIICIVNP